MADTTDSKGSGFAAMDATADALTPMIDADVSAASSPRPDTAGRLDDAKATIKDKTADLRTQASDKALALVQDGKAKATGALDQLSQMLTDAAGQVDEKLGEQYGQYARTAADQVQTFAASINDKSVDDLVADARAFVNKSPAVAIGIATAVGFVVARVLSSGFDQRDAA